MPTTNLVFTCSWCGRTHNAPVDHPRGSDGDEVAALAHISGRPREDMHSGPICPPCLESWRRSLSGDHFSRCLQAAKHVEARTGKAAQVYSQFLRGASPGPGPDGTPLPGTAQGVWVCSTGRFQEIPANAKTTRPRRDAWKQIKERP